jgi:release factor glutamine methyltransferase
VRRTTDLLLPDQPDRGALVTRLRLAGCVFAEDEADVLLTAATTADELDAMVQQRVQGTPLELIVGWAEFAGLRIGVAPGVFVPRQRTRLLLQYAYQLAPPRPVVVELCCGSAAVSVVLASTLKEVELYATDIDPIAVQCARRNLVEIAPRAVVFDGDLYDPLPSSLAGRIDLLLANAPYVPTESIALMPPEARLYEPRIALDGGTDGIDVHRRIAQSAGRWLTPQGHLLVETSRAQAAGTVAAFERHGLVAEVVSSDELDATVVIGQLATPDARDTHLVARH